MYFVYFDFVSFNSSVFLSLWFLCCLSSFLVSSSTFNKSREFLLFLNIMNVISDFYMLEPPSSRKQYNFSYVQNL